MSPHELFYNNVKNITYKGTQAEDTKFIYNKVQEEQRMNIFTDKYKKNDIPIETKSDGKDYSSTDFGENVGDKCITNLCLEGNFPEQSVPVSSSKNLKKKNDEFSKLSNRMKNHCKVTGKCSENNGIYIFNDEKLFYEYNSLFIKIGQRGKIKLDYKKPIQNNFYSTDSGFFTITEIGKYKVIDMGGNPQESKGKLYTTGFGFIDYKQGCTLSKKECEKIELAGFGVAAGLFLGPLVIESVAGAGTIEKIATSGPVAKGVQKSVNKISEIFNKKPDITTLMDKFSTEEIQNMSLENLRKIGSSEATSSDAIRILEGTKQDALKFFESRVIGEINTVVNSGGKIIKIGYDKFGNKLTYRDFSVINGSFPTIELFKGDTGTWITKIKFQ